MPLWEWGREEGYGHFNIGSRWWWSLTIDWGPGALDILLMTAGKERIHYQRPKT